MRAGALRNEWQRSVWLWRVTGWYIAGEIPAGAEVVGEVLVAVALHVGANGVFVLGVGATVGLLGEDRREEAVAPAEVVDAFAGGAAVAVDEGMNADQFTVDVGGGLEDLFGEVDATARAEPVVELGDEARDRGEEGVALLPDVIGMGAGIRAEGDVAIEAEWLGAAQEADEVREEPAEDAAVDAGEHGEGEGALGCVGFERPVHHEEALRDDAEGLGGLFEVKVVVPVESVVGRAGRRRH